LLWAIGRWSFFKTSGIRIRVLKGVFVLKFIVGVGLSSIYTSHYQKRSEGDIFKYEEDGEVMYGA